MNIDERLLPVTLSEEPSVYVKQNRLFVETHNHNHAHYVATCSMNNQRTTSPLCMQSLLLIYHEGDILHKQSPCVGAYFKFLQVFFTPFHTNYH